MIIISSSQDDETACMPLTGFPSVLTSCLLFPVRLHLISCLLPGVFWLSICYPICYLLPYEEIVNNMVSQKTDRKEGNRNVNCIFNCKFFPATTLEIWQLLLQTYIVKLSGFLRRSRNSFSFFSRSPINPNRKRSQGRRAQACLYAVSDPDYPWLREVKDSITPFHAAKGFLFCTSLSSA